MLTVPSAFNNIFHSLWCIIGIVVYGKRWYNINSVIKREQLKKGKFATVATINWLAAFISINCGKCQSCVLNFHWMACIPYCSFHCCIIQLSLLQILYRYVYTFYITDAFHFSLPVRFFFMQQQSSILNFLKKKMNSFLKFWVKINTSIGWIEYLIIIKIQDKNFRAVELCHVKHLYLSSSFDLTKVLTYL